MAYKYKLVKELGPDTLSKIGKFIKDNPKVEYIRKEFVQTPANTDESEKLDFVLQGTLEKHGGFTPLDIEKYSTLYPNQEIFNLFTEPIDTQEIVDLFPEIKNLPQYKPNRIEYDYTTVFSNTGYIQSKEDTLNDIKKFINEFSCK